MRAVPAPRSSAMQHLADRIRDILGDDPRLTEKTMFGGLTFLLEGRILVGCRKDGRILLSVGRENYADALARPGASAMSQAGRAMTGFVWVEADAIEDDDDLADWVGAALAWVGQLPPKPLKPPKAPAKR